MPLGITLISAGSHTDPGGYTGAGGEKLHRTEKGKVVKLRAAMSEGEHGFVVPPSGGRMGGPAEAGTPNPAHATEQFVIADQRSAAAVAERLRSLGYEPVWKDWDASLSESRES